MLGPLHPIKNGNAAVLAKNVGVDSTIEVNQHFQRIDGQTNVGVFDASRAAIAMKPGTVFPYFELLCQVFSLRLGPIVRILARRVPIVPKEIGRKVFGFRVQFRV